MLRPAQGDPVAVRMLVLVVGVSALVAGLYGRFKGLGTWPLGADEFYISRSIDNVLRTGLPRFPCGGYYTRGLIFQYVVAALRLLGWSPEFAGRFVAGLSSLAALPAVYLLGRRVHGSLAGWLAVIILLVSVWEIEMARFGRMYAPFQAVFAWYLVAYLRFTVAGQASALAWMAALSVLGVLTWEGGALLGVANLLAVLSSRRDGPLDWRRLALFGLLMVPLYLATLDLRGLADQPPAEAGAVDDAMTPLQVGAAWFAPLWQHPVWAWGGMLLPFALTVPALRWIASFRGRILACAGLCVALLAAAVHVFIVSAAVLVLLMLLRFMDWRELSSAPARYFRLALAAFLSLWLLYGVFSAVGPQGAPPDAGFGAGALRVAQLLFGYPDIFDDIVRPWGRTLPLLSLGLAAALAYLCWMSIVARHQAADAIAVLLSLIIVIALAIGAFPTDRVETRYTFFLYPLLVVLAVSAVLRIVRRPSMAALVPAWAAAALPLACFAAGEDFQPGHILAVDSGRVNFRVGMSPVRADHYYPRSDMRAAGEWLTAETKPGDVVVTGIPTLDEYYRHVDFFFLDETDSRYETYVCQDGRTERWTNRPVLYRLESLRPLVQPGRRVYASLYSAAEQRLRDFAPSAGWSVTRVWTADSGGADVVLITGQPGAARSR